MTTISAVQVDEAFAVIEAAAVAGDRAPVNSDHGGDGPVTSLAVSKLCKAGRIQVEVYGRNFRRITILTGPNAGKATAPAPKGWEPYKIVGTETLNKTRAMARKAAQVTLANVWNGG